MCLSIDTTHLSIDIDRSTCVPLQIRRYDSAHGLFKKQAATLYTEDIVALQDKLVDKALSLFSELVRRVTQPAEEGDGQGWVDELLLRVCGELVLGATVNFDWTVGARGFHRAETVNLGFDELNFTLEGGGCLEDAPSLARKRRYDGREETEVAYHMHGGNGLFCIEGSMSMDFSRMAAGRGAELDVEAECEELRTVADRLRFNLANWRRSQWRSCCPLCSYMFLNYILNPIYWDQFPPYDEEEGDEPCISLTFADKIIRSRPQEGFVLPHLVYASRGTEQGIFSTSVRVQFHREKLAKVSAVRSLPAQHARCGVYRHVHRHVCVVYRHHSVCL